MKRWFVLFLSFTFFLSAETDYPFLSKDTFLTAADHTMDCGSPLLDPAKIKTGDIIFIRTPCLQVFFVKFLPQVRSKFILVTSNGCHTIDERYRPLLENPYLTAWFGMNMTLVHPKAHPIPLGIPCNRPGTAKKGEILKTIQSDFSIDSFFKPKPVHTYVNFSSCTHCSRSPVQDYFVTQPYCKIASKRPFVDYLDDLKNSRFVISPRGANIDCYRTWETLYAGSIPVVESWGIDAVYEGLPVIVVDDLTTVTEEVLGEAFEKLKTKQFNLDKLHADYWLNEFKKAQERCF